MKSPSRSFVVFFLAALLGAGCGGSSPGGTGAAGQTGAPAGMTGQGGAGAVAGNSGGAGEVSPGAGGTAGEAAAGATGAAGSVGGAGSAGAPVDAGTAGRDAGAGGGTAGSGGAAGSDAGIPLGDGGTSSKILIYAVTTGFRHGSIGPAAKAIADEAAKFGLTTDQVGVASPGDVPDPTKLTTTALARYGAVVLLANSGEPFGYPATTEIQNLIDYVHAGGALIAIEDATHCYDGTFNGHPASAAYITLLGADFIGHPGGVAPATCTKVGTHPAVTHLPPSFKVTDEIYAFSKYRTDNQVVLNCVSSTATGTVRPISWVRDEGAGRYFFTALGHNDVEWTAPLDPAAATSRLVADHVVPALLWAMRR
jgi:hypothetical protein